jgi:hypothetical protein
MDVLMKLKACIGSISKFKNFGSHLKPASTKAFVIQVHIIVGLAVPHPAVGAPLVVFEI